MVLRPLNERRDFKSDVFSLSATVTAEEGRVDDGLLHRDVQALLRTLGPSARLDVEWVVEDQRPSATLPPAGAAGGEPGVAALIVRAMSRRGSGAAVGAAAAAPQARGED